MFENKHVSSAKPKAGTGITGLDQILLGGFPLRRLYLVEGAPGTGKTTLALQFLLEGRKQGERSLYVTLSETNDEVGDVAESHGWCSADKQIDCPELPSATRRPPATPFLYGPRVRGQTDPLTAVARKPEEVNKNLSAASKTA